MKWEFEKVLIKNVCAGDTNIFYHNEKWWLFTNIDSSDLSKYVGDEHDSELHIYYADNLHSEWKRHKDNPVIFDSNYARNGGKILNQDNILYRVYQTHDFETYGKGFGVAKITKLTTEDFEEVKLFQVEPNFYKDITGTHHFSFENNLAVFDHLTIRRK